MGERIYFHFLEGYVKYAHVQEEKNLIKIALDQVSTRPESRQLELTVHASNIHIKDQVHKNTVFSGDRPDLYTTIAGTGFDTLTETMEIHRELPCFAVGLLSAELSKPGRVLSADWSSTDRMMFRIFLAPPDLSEEEFVLPTADFNPHVIVNCRKGRLIFVLEHDPIGSWFQSGWRNQLRSDSCSIRTSLIMLRSGDSADDAPSATPGQDANDSEHEHEHEKDKA